VRDDDDDDEDDEVEIEIETEDDTDTDASDHDVHDDDNGNGNDDGDIGDHDHDHDHDTDTDNDNDNDKTNDIGEGGSDDGDNGDGDDGASQQGLGDSTRRSKAVAQKKKKKKKRKTNKSLSHQAMAVGADETGRCTFGNIAAAITRLRIPGSAKGVSRHTLHGAFPHVTHARVNAVLKMAVAARKIIQIKDSFKVRKEHAALCRCPTHLHRPFLRPIVICLKRPWVIYLLTTLGHASLSTDATAC